MDFDDPFNKPDLPFTSETRPGNFHSVNSLNRQIMNPNQMSEQFLKDIRLFYLAATTKSKEFIPLYNKAVALYRLYRFQTAANTFQKLVELDPRFIQGYYMKGLCLRKLNKFEEAKEEFNRSVSLNSAFIESYFQLACIYEELEELEKANMCLDNYIHFDQTNAEVFFKKGVNLCELGYTLEAQHHLQHAVQLNPNHYNAQFYVGFIFYKIYSFSPALRHFKKTIELEPDYIGECLVIAASFQNFNGTESNTQRHITTGRFVWKSCTDSMRHSRRRTS